MLMAHHHRLYQQEIKIKILQNGGIRRPAGPASGTEAQSGSSREQGLERLAWIDRGTCAPLPFHITGGQPAVGQGVVVHARGLCLES
ncbi:unnamed protein product [Spirodela intermedia]|uniref:Uncharacterized protein n=1 Tax=Spirodela intermedia TaxID=51605 RepID=A0ABN7ECF8_SPIIN|nr:unnamed protein product [Spirodela intermedia]